MILLDAYALIAFLTREPAESEVAEVLGLERAAISAVNLAESVDHCLRLRDISGPELRDAIGMLEVGGRLAVVTADADTAWRAGEIRAQHYRRRTRELSLADCFLLAAATAEDRIATADPPVAETARALGIDVIALPDSTGVRP